MKQYEVYKDSGLEWLGNVPEHWKVLPFKRGVSINNGRDYKHVQSENGYPVIGSGGQFAFASEYLYDGEAILLGRKGTIDKPRYFNGKFWTVDTMFYAIPNENCIAKYMFYQALTIPFNMYSTDTALPSMTQTDLGNHPMCFPPLSEQCTIAAYLDHKVSQIDALISEKEKMVDDLKAYRSSVITEAVTKGLDKNVEMKDSGLEWLGSVPEHWEVIRLKYCSNIVLGKMLMSAPPKGQEEAYTLEKYLKSRNVGWLSLNLGKDDVEEMFFNKAEKDLYKLREGDIVMNEGGDIGKVALWHNVDYDCYIQNSINKITPSENLDSSFLSYWLYSVSMTGYFWSIVSQISIAHLTKDKLANTPVLLPSLPEQRTIAAYLNHKVGQIDALISEKEKMVDDLKAYRSSLITEAVTGKIDLRDWQTQKA